MLNKTKIIYIILLTIMASFFYLWVGFEPTVIGLLIIISSDISYLEYLKNKNKNE
jgi:hypothetical protein